jgi:outer membrane protein
VAGGALIASPSSAAAQTPTKFAVVDVRRAVLETEEGLRVQANLKKLFDSRQIELENKQRALGQEKEDLDREAQAGKTSKEALQRKFEGLQKRAVELQGLTMDYQREMQRKEGELTTPILQRVLAIVRRIAAQDGYEMVLEKSAVPYYRADLEVTDRAIQMYNGGLTSDAAPAPTPGKAPAGSPPGTSPPAKPAAGKPAAPAKPAPAKPAAPPAKK